MLTVSFSSKYYWISILIGKHFTFLMLCFELHKVKLIYLISSTIVKLFCGIKCRDIKKSFLILFIKTFTYLKYLHKRFEVDFLYVFWITTVLNIFIRLFCNI